MVSSWEQRKFLSSKQHTSPSHSKFNILLISQTMSTNYRSALSFVANIELNCSVVGGSKAENWNLSCEWNEWCGKRNRRAKTWGAWGRIDDRILWKVFSPQKTTKGNRERKTNFDQPQSKLLCCYAKAQYWFVQIAFFGSKTYFIINCSRTITIFPRSFALHFHTWSKSSRACLRIPFCR